MSEELMAAAESSKRKWPYTLLVVGGAENEVVSLQNASEAGPYCLTCSARDRSHSEVSSDYFDAFAKIRSNFLEPLGLTPFCYGASLNVWPSAMGRQMGAGLQAYQVAMGQSGGHLVWIFDSGPDVIPSSVEEQRDHALHWRESLNRSRG